jgi:VanZ family protein
MKDRFVEKFLFFVEYFVPVFIVAGIIFYLSSQAGLGDIEDNVLETVLRKGAHFMEYGLLAFFLWRLFYNGFRFFAGAAFWFTFLLTVIYAISDEWHQFFIEGRSGKIIDVAVDALSALVVLQAMLFFVGRKIKNVLLGFAEIIMLGGIVIWMIGQVGQGQIDSDVLRTDNNKQNLINNILKEDKSKKISIEERQGVKYEGENLSIIEVGLKARDASYQDVNDKKVVLPESILHKVPFTTQSPFARWDELHEEACEEASLIMLKYYNEIMPNDLLRIPKKEAESEIQKLVKYQIKKYGDFHDSDMQRLKEIGREYFELNNLKIIENFKLDDLKRELINGGVILIPTAGREVHNPNFKALGPLYHNLVIIGYDDKAIVDSAGRKVKGVFITNDPGTRKGEGYKYDQKVLYKAIHDYPGDVNKILTGKKRAIVLLRQYSP